MMFLQFPPSQLRSSLPSRESPPPSLSFPLCHTPPSHRGNIAVSDGCCAGRHLAVPILHLVCSHHNAKRITIWKTCTRLVTTLAVILAAHYVRFGKRFPCLILKNSFGQMIMCRQFKTQCQIWNCLISELSLSMLLIQLQIETIQCPHSCTVCLRERIPTQYFKRHINLRYHSRTHSWYMVHWKVQPWLPAQSGKFIHLLQWLEEVTYSSPMIHLQCLQDVVTHTVHTAVACLLVILRSCLDSASIWTCHQESVAICHSVVFLWPKNVFYLFIDIHWRWYENKVTLQQQQGVKYSC